MSLDADELIELKKLVASSAKSNKSDYAHSDQDIDNFIKNCFRLLPEEKQKEFVVTLKKQSSNNKLNEFANSLNRSLNSFGSTDEALTNFKNLDLSKYNDQISPFVSANFNSALEASHAVFREGMPSISAQIQTVLTTSSSKIPEKDHEKLFEITANVLTGIVTKKNMLHQRNKDTAIISNNRINQQLVSATTQYIEQNFSDLSDLDTKTLRKIGTSLKQDYLNVINHSRVPNMLKVDDIFREFNKHSLETRLIGINLSAQGMSSSPNTVSSSPVSSRASSSGKSAVERI